MSLRMKIVRRWSGRVIRALKNYSFLGLVFLLVSCAPDTPTATPQVITVYSTYAATPWLADLYECAGASSAVSRVDDPSSADIILRVGEPPILTSPAYPIGEEEILVVTHRQSPAQNLTREEVRELFMGRGDPAIQVWVYPPEEDVQEVFDRFVMEGGSATPRAMLAATPQQMSDTLVNEPGTAGILPRRWKAGDSREVFSVATVPVLAIPAEDAGGVVAGLIACLQK